jgi:hypothetical protein
VEKDPSAILNDCVKAVDAGDGADEAVRSVYRDLAGADLPAGEWPEALYAALSENELVFQLNEALAGPRPLHELPPEMEKATGRPVGCVNILRYQLKSSLL